MIPYENITISDARMYWSGACVFVVDGIGTDAVTVSPQYLDIDDTEDHGARFDNHGVSLCPLRSGFHPTPEARRLVGSELFMSPEYILHRFPVEYVPVNGTVVRVTVEPTDRRAFKGLTASHVTGLPILPGVQTDVDSDQPETVELYHRVTSSTNWLTTSRSWDEFCRGVASVLEVGIPSCMERAVPRVTASRNAKALVASMFADEAKNVAVPDFSAVVIRGQTDRNSGLVIHRGRIIGNVSYADGTVTYSPSEPATGNARVRAGQIAVAQHLITDTIDGSEGD